MKQLRQLINFERCRKCGNGNTKRKTMMEGFRRADGLEFEIIFYRCERCEYITTYYTLIREDNTLLLQHEKTV